MIQLSISGLLQNRPISLPASKSESNRLLIMNALANQAIEIKNLSSARDTQTMLRLLNSTEEVLDVLDAGTTMRFLTAYCVVSQRKAILTGTPRMKLRPLGILVDALIRLGAKIDFMEKPGFPPIKISGIEKQLCSGIEIRGDVSSQYISALLLIGPILPEGIRLNLIGKVGSKPYIEMTLGLMKKFGIESTWEDDSIHIPKQNYAGGSYTVESDWSAASYWYSLLALSDGKELVLKGLRPNSFQADIRIAMIMDKLGVGSEFRGDGVRIFKKERGKFNFYDFGDCPDIAQTVAVTCAALGISATFKGLESLRIKETDRIAALQNELRKIGGDLIERNAEWELMPCNCLPSEASFHTYEDHRMAMAFAPLATRMKVILDEPDVVVKSYPGFWDDLQLVGINIQKHEME
jgi:3-phosphoshikimate 1-carboxyvinyltransferase